MRKFYRLQNIEEVVRREGSMLCVVPGTIIHYPGIEI